MLPQRCTRMMRPPFQPGDPFARPALDGDGVHSGCPVPKRQPHIVDIEFAREVRQERLVDVTGDDQKAGRPSGRRDLTRQGHHGGRGIDHDLVARAREAADDRAALSRQAPHLGDRADEVGAKTQVSGVRGDLPVFEAVKRPIVRAEHEDVGISLGAAQIGHDIVIHPGCIEPRADVPHGIVPFGVILEIVLHHRGSGGEHAPERLALPLELLGILRVGAQEDEQEDETEAYAEQRQERPKILPWHRNAEKTDSCGHGLAISQLG